MKLSLVDERRHHRRRLVMLGVAFVNRTIDAARAAGRRRYALPLEEKLA
jgi:hypothetical protein